MRYEVLVVGAGGIRRSLSLVDATTPDRALSGYLDLLRERVKQPVEDEVGRKGADEARDLLHSLLAPDTCFEVIPDDQVHRYISDHDGQVRSLDQVAARRRRMGEALGIDIL